MNQYNVVQPKQWYSANNGKRMLGTQCVRFADRYQVPQKQGAIGDVKIYAIV